MKFIAKILTKIIIVVIVAGCLSAGGFFGWKKFTEVQIEKRYATVEKELVSCAELVTVKMKYTDIVSIKKKTMLSKSYSIVKYTGIIRAGIENIEDSDFKISDDGKVLEIILPDTAILGNEISRLEVFDEQRSLFIPITMQEMFDEIEASRKIMNDQAVEDGILKEARSQAESIIKRVMLGVGFESVVIH